MTAGITPSTTGVIELGPGTGSITQALLERGLSVEKLTLVESGEEFARLLADRFPGIQLLQMDAASLRFTQPFPGRKVGAVVSGLPLLSMAPRKVVAILVGAFSHLEPAGVFYQFTYGPSCPVPRQILERLGLKAVRTGFTVANLPPASVYRITRRGRHWPAPSAGHDWNDWPPQEN
ncbi:methyltransferase domain-containing protein [Paucibacter sp. O1-1]|nr:methyltransferase domain-containing protein [Paucibacter sp. O1-1]MDA3825016.1 methyltransferase domain-containing protein [Paucibacter sp. O1-1]